jgi:hypothetical protein
MLSPADQRVISYLRQRQRATLCAIGMACFAVTGKPERSGIRPAAAHLARMQERRLIKRIGRHYLLEAETSGPGLFENETSPVAIF